MRKLSWLIICLVTFCSYIPFRSFRKGKEGQYADAHFFKMAQLKIIKYYGIATYRRCKPYKIEYLNDSSIVVRGALRRAFHGGTPEVYFNAYSGKINRVTNSK